MKFRNQNQKCGTYTENTKHTFFILDKIYFPISRTCSATFAVKEAGVRKKSYPFDWAGLSYKSLANILDNGIDKIFSDYEIINHESQELPIIWEKTYNMLLIHERESQIEEIKSKYIKRYNRLIKDLKNSKEVTLVQSSSCERKMHSHFKDFEEHFKSPIPDESIDDNSIECVKESILKINPNINIKVTKYEVWDNIVEELKNSI